MLVCWPADVTSRSSVCWPLTSISSALSKPMPVLAGPVTPMRAKFCRHVPVDVVPFSADWKARHKVECRKAGVFRPYDFVVSDELENCHKQSAKYILLDEVPADSDSESSSNESEDGNACAGKKWLVGAAADLQELKVVPESALLHDNRVCSARMPLWWLEAKCKLAGTTPPPCCSGVKLFPELDEWPVHKRSAHELLVRLLPLCMM